MKRKTSFILALLFVLTMLLNGCGKQAETKGEFTLASVPEPEVKSQIDDTISKFLQYYEAGNTKDALSLFVADSGATEESLSEYYAQVKELTQNPFVPYDAYYLKDLTKSDIAIKVKNAETDANYIEFTPGDKEFYCALYASEGEKVSYMMTILLQREGDVFKILYMNPTEFKINGNDAPALYETVKTLYNDGKLIASYINSCMLGLTLRPGGYLRYANDIEMEDMGYKLHSEITEKYELPFALEGTTNSSIGQIGIAMDETHGIIPLFLFKTDVPTSDKAAIEAEAEKVLEAIEKLSPGIRESFEYVRMNATNDTLDENTTSIDIESLTLALK